MGIARIVRVFTQAEIAALGSTTVGRISLNQLLPANSFPLAVFGRNLGVAGTGITSLTLGLTQGSGITTSLITAQTVHQANNRFTAPILVSASADDDHYNFYVPWTPHVQFTSAGGNLSALTGLTNGCEVTAFFWIPD